MERGEGVGVGVGVGVGKRGREMPNSWLLYTKETGIGSYVIYAITYQGTDFFQVMF